jgi:hypothetical protein
MSAGQHYQADQLHAPPRHSPSVRDEHDDVFLSKSSSSQSQTTPYVLDPPQRPSSSMDVDPLPPDSSVKHGIATSTPPTSMADAAPASSSAYRGGLKLLPRSLFLLYLASAYLSHARSLTSLLCRKPETRRSSDDQKPRSWASYSQLMVRYRRYVLASVTLLREVLREGSDLKIELRARCMLAEVLIRETEGSSEAERVISKGVRPATAVNIPGADHF